MTTTSYSYDAHGDQTQQIIGFGTPQAATTTSKYNGDGEMTQQVDADGNINDYYFDALGVQTDALLGAGTAQDDSSTSLYDGDGNLTLACERKISRALVTGSPHSFFTKLLYSLVNGRASARGSRSVTFAPRAGRELISALTVNSHNTNYHNDF